MGLLIGLIIWALFVTAGYVVGKQKGRVAPGSPWRLCWAWPG
jgi:hypothetical protein